jgi:arsenate reductase (thioredoxin)
MPETRLYQVLFLCTGNSARSILGEYLLCHLGAGRFAAQSAGSNPRGEVHPLALQVLHETSGIDASGARSKSWEELRHVPFDFVITVCDNARESCPVFPGQPIVAHWGMPDPAAVEGTVAEQLKCFRDTAREIQRRLELFINLPIDKLDRLRLEQRTRQIGEPQAAQILW